VGSSPIISTANDQVDGLRAGRVDVDLPLSLQLQRTRKKYGQGWPDPSPAEKTGALTPGSCASSLAGMIEADPNPRQGPDEKPLVKKLVGRSRRQARREPPRLDL
jgi:hypothetical protein